MDFARAVQIILDLEGGLVEDPRDPGGITKFGISLSAYPGLGREGILALSLEQAKDIYQRDYWEKGKCDLLPPALRLIFFDSCVNQGVLAATKILQKSLGVEADGVLGPKTLEAAKRLSPQKLLAQRALAYIALPTFKSFGHGWLIRLFSVAFSSK